VRGRASVRPLTEGFDPDKLSKIAVEALSKPEERTAFLQAVLDHPREVNAWLHGTHQKGKGVQRSVAQAMVMHGRELSAQCTAVIDGWTSPSNGAMSADYDTLRDAVTKKAPEIMRTPEPVATPKVKQPFTL
jgi:hypothetical protein